MFKFERWTYRVKGLIGRQQDLVRRTLQGDRKIPSNALVGMAGLAFRCSLPIISQSRKRVLPHLTITISIGSQEGLCCSFRSFFASFQEGGLVADVVGLLTLRLVQPLARVEMRAAACDIAVSPVTHL